MKESLINAVLSQIEGNDVDLDTADKDTIQVAKDAGSNGADAGWSGFTYYSDTIEFFESNRKDILNLAKEYAEESGQTVDEMCKHWRCMDGVDSVLMVLLDGEDHDDYTQVANGFAWFALEEVGRWLEDNHETEEEDEA